MKVDAEIKPFYKLTLGNRDTCMGCYYMEDDWDIIIYGETIQEIMDMSPEVMVNSEICLASRDLEVVACVVYQGMIFEMTDKETKKIRFQRPYHDEEPLKVNEVPEEIRAKMQQMMLPPTFTTTAAGIVYDIEHSTRYKQLEFDKKIRDEERKRTKEESQRKEFEDSERKTYEHLKKKYEGND